MATPGWGTAEEVPGIATLDAGGGAWVNSLSCASAGNCAAGGFYGVGYDHTLAFVVDEVNGTWGNAQEVPGLGALTASGFAAVVSLSCASAGNCAAGGYYEDSSYLYHPFVVDEVNGTWGSAEEVSGLGALNDGGSVATTGPPLVSLSCASAGNCAAGGHYTDGVDQPAFVVDEVNGTWGPAEKVRGLDLLGGCQRMSTRSRAPPRATARPAGTTGTGDRRSWSTRSTALGAAPSRSPAWRR